MKGFIEFLKEQGIPGLAIGFVLGGAVSKLITALVTDIINPVLSVFLGLAMSLKDAYLDIYGVKIMYGDFLNVSIDFVVISLVVYFGFKVLGIKKK